MKDGVVRATGDPQGQEHVLSAWEAALSSFLVSSQRSVGFPFHLRCFPVNLRISEM